MKSIMQKEKECFLCRKEHPGDWLPDQGLHKHHVMFGTANRKLAEQDGLTVYLCPDHHEFGKDAVHRNAEVAKELKKEAQRAYERKHSREDWMNRYGKNYLYEEE